MTSQRPFERVPANVVFPDQEQAILDLWDEIDAFATSVEQRPASSEFSFYDGPPFPTGSPHYGNLLAGVLKDIVPRYWTMRGHRVERRFGWDTHGLPIELEVQKELGLSGPAEIAEFGVAEFNEACRTRVMQNTEPWEAITRRIGRWVDFENDYKTMDVDFMEPVWWVFKQLWDKGLVYKAFKVLPYSWGAATPLSNHEVNLGEYKDVEDPSITVRLRVTESTGPAEPGDYLLIWTTTPWTMPSNLGIAVGPDIPPRPQREQRATTFLEPATCPSSTTSPTRPMRELSSWSPVTRPVLTKEPAWSTWLPHTGKRISMRSEPPDST